MKGAFSMPICARKQTNGPPGADQGFSTASCNSHHALPQMVHLVLTRALLQPASAAVTACTVTQRAKYVVSNFSKSSQAGKGMLKLWACMCTLVTLHSLLYFSTWGVIVHSNVN